ncbi:MAG: hypothetical protein ACREUY_02095, partial [Burkholderiales bacterium]
ELKQRNPVLAALSGTGAGEYGGYGAQENQPQQQNGSNAAAEKLHHDVVPPSIRFSKMIIKHALNSWEYFSLVGHFVII